VGLIYKESGYKWPDSAAYINNVYPALKKTLTTVDLQKSALISLINPGNWQYILSRANLMAKTMEAKWGITKKLSELDTAVAWTINGTTAENGKRFRFKGDTCGDYELGYTEAKNFKLAEAMAMSAAFPGLIGPLKITPQSYTWRKKKSWDSTEEEQVTLPYESLHIYDGGVYDNLGLEPFFDNATGKMKIDGCKLLVSDAGSRFNKGRSGFSLLRVLDITMEQTRALRVRGLMNFFSKDNRGGAYLMLGANPLSMAPNSPPDHWQAPDEINKAANYATTLQKVAAIDFERISTHGYQLAKAVQLLVTKN
jgi:NTE family protein